MKIILRIIYTLITFEAVQVDDIVKGEMEKRWKTCKYSLGWYNITQVWGGMWRIRDGNQQEIWKKNGKDGTKKRAMYLIIRSSLI